MAVNISDALRSAVVATIKGNRDKDTPAILRDIFLPIRAELVSLMANDSFLKFQHDPLYQEA